MMRSLILLIFCTLSLSIFSQTHGVNHERCGHHQWLSEYEESHPGYTEQINQSLRNYKKIVNEEQRSTSLVTIPVHVIIVHPPGQAEGTGVNFSLAHVQSQIDVINQDFGRYNADAGNTPGVFPAADTGIQFCLATVDPDGNPTDGITRYATNTSMGNSAGRTEVISATRWPRESYMNIWSAPNLPFLGLASVPNTGGLPSPNQDFVLVDSGTFGGPGFGTSAPYDLGRTTTHEIGHWLGLLHVWGTGNGSCNVDDGIDDTPNQSGSNFGCPSHPSPTCNNGGDMFMNYMDYVNDNCMNAFTVEQGNYMNTILNTSRAGLTGASATNCTTVVPLAIDVLSQTDPSCSDIEDGTVLVSASGGTPPYTYSIDGLPVTSSDFFDGLAGGNHTITAFDQDGNTASVDVFLTTPSALAGTVTIDNTNECPSDNNGQVTLAGSGATPPYLYSINNGSSQSSGVFSGLANGAYAYQIFDVNGCDFQGIFELVGGTEISIELSSINDVSCPGASDGSVSGSGEGGSGSLSYSIDGETYVSSGDFMGLGPASYFFYAQDENGCYDSVAFEIVTPPALMVDLEVFDISCAGSDDGIITITASGGNGTPYIYTLNGDNISDEEMGLSAGAYQLSISDPLGCDTTIAFTIVEPDLLFIDAQIQSVSCFGDTDGSATLIASGGTGSYTYSLNGVVNNTGIFSDLAAGTYQGSVIDENDCESSLEIVITISSAIAGEIISQENVSCQGATDGSVEIGATNTTGAVSYTLEGGTPTTDPVFSGLGAGDYLITISDESGCDAGVFVTITEPTMLMLEASILSNASCAGAADGSITLTATGGTAPYSYAITPVDSDLDNLAAGTYTLVVTDNNGCIASTAVDITEPPAITPFVNAIFPVSCPEGNNGRVTVAATGGSGSGYIYSIAGPSGTLSSTIGLFTDLVYGLHTITVSDDMGCQGVSEVLIPYENDFSATLEGVTDIPCFAGLGGALDLTVTGGLGEITYLLDDALPVDPTDLNTHAGEHTLSILDENECFIELTFTLMEPEELILMHEISSDDVLTITASGGTQPYTYSYDGGMTFSSDSEYIIGGSTEVDVVVMDANGCEIAESIIVSSVTEIDMSWSVSAYPNPFMQNLTIAIDLLETTELSIQVLDLTGKVAVQLPAQQYDAGRNAVSVELGDLSGALYLIKIISPQGARIIKATKL